MGLQTLPKSRKMAIYIPNIGSIKAIFTQYLLKMAISRLDWPDKLGQPGRLSMICWPSQPCRLPGLPGQPFLLGQEPSAGSPKLTGLSSFLLLSHPPEPLGSGGWVFEVMAGWIFLKI